MRIPVTGKIHSMEDMEEMHKCISSGEEITYGSWNVKFEKMLAEYIGVPYAYFVNSGSSANLLAFMAFTSPHMHKKWRVLPGDEIITVAAGFPTTVAPIVQYGAIPVFVDIDETSYNIDVKEMYKAVSPKTKGVFIAHTLGNPFDLGSVKNFCQKHNLFLIEDNSDALGSTYNGYKTGSFGDVSTSSFYPAHHFSTGQGGAVFTKDPLIAKILKSMRGWGKDCICPPNTDNLCGQRFTQQWGNLPLGYDHKFVFSEFGYNLQGTNVLAALGCSQMERVNRFTYQRHLNFEALAMYIVNTKLPVFLPVSEPLADPSWFGFPLRLTPSHSRRMVIDSLEKKGIGTRTLFAGNILKQPCFVDNPVIQYRQIGDLHNTDNVMNNMFWVGCHHGLVYDDMMYIGNSLKEALC